MRFFSFRAARFDELGLRRALSDRMVPFLVAAMAFLAALAIAGWLGAAVLTRHWESGAGAILTVQLPNPAQPSATGSESRLVAVQALLAAAPGIDSAETLSDDQVNALLRPWLGADIKNLAIPVPAVIAVHMTPDVNDLTSLAAQLAKAAPGTIVEDQAAWAGRLGTLARSLQACAGLVLLIVTLVTAAVISVATRSGLAARREAILIVYQLGATDSYIARRFATRAAALAYLGGLIGGLCALPVMFLLATLAAPLAAAPSPDAAIDLLPPLLWSLPVILPGATAVIGYLTTQILMRQWLRRLP
ncbi:MAG: cell division protein FtsX [Acetobacteraceae bacterium]|jgi:cell division transport system permease protein